MNVVVPFPFENSVTITSAGGKDVLHPREMNSQEQEVGDLLMA